jgi:hypothetical protein
MLLALSTMESFHILQTAVGGTDGIKDFETTFYYMYDHASRIESANADKLLQSRRVRNFECAGRGGRGGRGGGRSGGRGSRSGRGSGNKVEYIRAQKEARQKQKEASAAKQTRGINAEAVVPVPIDQGRRPGAAASIESTVNPAGRQNIGGGGNRVNFFEEVVAQDGSIYRRINATTIRYNVSYYDEADVRHGSLVDGGASGGFAGGDVLLLDMSTFAKAM